MLDSSNSIWTPNFRRQVDFVRNVVHHFQISETRMKVSMVTFSERPRMVVSLRQNQKPQLKQTLKHVVQDGGVSSYTSKALHFMRSVCFSERAGARQNVTKIGIVISDGHTSDPIRTAYEAMKAREEGIHMFAVGVGENIKMNVLEHIASKPHDFYLLTAKGYKGLKHMRTLLAGKACAGRWTFNTLKHPCFCVL